MNPVVAAAAGSAQFLLRPLEENYLASFSIHLQVLPFPRQTPTLSKTFLSFKNFIVTKPAI